MARILVVDDEPSIAAVLSEILTTAGHQVFVANDLAQALDLTRQQTPELMLVDIGLPSGQDAGFELLQRIKERKPPIPVIMITGAASKERVVTALRGGAEDFIEKPFSLDEIIKRVDTVLSRQKRLLF